MVSLVTYKHSLDAQILNQLPADVLAELERALPARRRLSSDDDDYRGPHRGSKCPKAKPCPKVPCDSC